MKPVAPFLGVIRRHCQDYFDEYEKNRTANYEDLYYAVAQISDHLHQEYENPAVEPFVRKIAENLRDDDLLSPCSELAKIAELADEALSFIHRIVEGMLFRSPSQLDHLRCLVGAARDPAVKRVDVFTLNHDLVLEKVFRHSGIEFVDGFGAVRNGMRYWWPRSYEWSSSRCYLFKLHGSVDWLLYRPSGKAQWRQIAGIPVAGAHEPIRDWQGNPQYPLLNGKSLLLIGTFNKMLGYTGGLFADLHSLFRKHLWKSSRCIVSGYGFRDKGINRVLVEWLNYSYKHRLVLVHGQPDEAREAARGAIRDRWDRRRHDGQLRVIQKWVEDTTWEDVQQVL